MTTFFKFRLSGGRYRLNDNDGATWPETEEFTLQDEGQVISLAAQYDPDILDIVEFERLDNGDYHGNNITAYIAEEIWKQMRTDYSDGDPLPKLVMDYIDWQSDFEEMEQEAYELAAHNQSYRARS